MKINPPQRLLSVRQGALEITLNEAGQVYEIQVGSIQLNAYKTPSFLNGPFALYLRAKNGKVVNLFKQATRLERYENGFRYEGKVWGVPFSLEIILSTENLYFFALNFLGQGKGLADVLFVHDIGLAEEGGVRSNELYTSQYVDHHIVKNENGFVILSRENMGKPNPGLAIGSIGIRSIHYATDLMQFYTPKSREKGIPTHLCDDLPDVNRQYECGAALLQSESFSLQEKQHFLFYGFYSSDEKSCYKNMPSLDATLWKTPLKGQPCLVERALLKKEFVGPLLSGNDVEEKELEKRYPKRFGIEKIRDKTLSFFLEDGTHIVHKEKDLEVERGHGTILYRYPRGMAFEKDSFCATCLMDGAFGQQIVLGNTSLNKLTPVSRGLLDVPHADGIRILLKIDGSYRLLGEPSLFEMSLNSATWDYRWNNDEIEVRVDIAKTENAYRLHFASKTGKAYELLVLFEGVLGEQERLVPFEVQEESFSWTYSFGEGTYFQSKYPALRYRLSFDKEAKRHEDEIFFSDGITRLPALQVFALHQSEFSLLIQASLDGETMGLPLAPQKEKERFENQFRSDFLHLHFSVPKEPGFAEKINLITPWLIQGALIHYLVPHGLEQNGGAAWGTRDVAQGPYELFSAFGNFPAMRQLILDLYSHQNPTTGEWPQWFMLDAYAFGAGDCHGDVVFWPLGILADYLEKTGDNALLKSELPFQENPTKAALEMHVASALKSIASRFIEGTDLLCYGGGDWDDTLQPIDAAMKARLVSPWTQELAYQVLSRLGAVYPEKETKELLLSLAKRVQRGYEEKLVTRWGIPGFLIVEKDGRLTSLITPDDTTTGIHYRLLPYTRAILSELATPEQAHAFSQLIDEELTFSDGIRLMDQPARYDGGVSHLFVRAEQAANVGREISLCYVHAEIRYIESMTVLGEAEKAFKTMEKIIPIGLQDVVKNATLRQANTYFSSSDPLFNDRYAFAKGMKELKEGKVPVNGGWRVYSSGNGIFLARLLGDFFGLKIAEKGLAIDPVLPQSFADSSVELDLYGKRMKVLYHLGTKGCGIEKIRIDGQFVSGQKLQNPYRNAGIFITKDKIKGRLIEVFTA